jgi:hypothetical protein
LPLASDRKFQESRACWVPGAFIDLSGCEALSLLQGRSDRNTRSLATNGAAEMNPQPFADPGPNFPNEWKKFSTSHCSVRWPVALSSFQFTSVSGTLKAILMENGNNAPQTTIRSHRDCLVKRSMRI